MKLLDNDLKPVKLLTVNSSSWLKYFDYSNSLYIRATRVIINYILINKYKLRFFPKKEFKCPYDFYSIKRKHHILHDCKRYNNYWNFRKDTIVHFILFLKFNNKAFLFGESKNIT